MITITKHKTEMIQNSPTILKLNSLEDYHKITQTNLNANLIIFCAGWSGSSCMLLESLKENGKEFSMLINKVFIVYSEESPELVKEFKIKDVPTSILTIDNKTIHTFNGLFSIKELTSAVEQYSLNDNVI